jgi:hypothetical protein
MRKVIFQRKELFSSYVVRILFKICPIIVFFLMGSRVTKRISVPERAHFSIIIQLRKARSKNLVEPSLYDLLQL